MLYSTVLTRAPGGTDLKHGGSREELAHKHLIDDNLTSVHEAEEMSQYSGTHTLQLHCVHLTLTQPTREHGLESRHF